MGRIVKKPGDVFRLPLGQEGHFGYAQWIGDGTAIVFLYSDTGETTLESILEKAVAFRILVFGDTPGRYDWKKVGRASIPAAYEVPQRYAKRDAHSGKLFVSVGGMVTPAIPEEIKGLETLAAWAHPHLVERLDAVLSGRESEWVKVLRVAV